MFYMKLINNSSMKNKNCKTYEGISYDDELDDERSIIYEICEVFESTGCISFYVTGFGEEKWPVDCLFDLTTVIEEVPQIINKINNDNYNFVLDFYEQGIEREIVFQEHEGKVNLQCISRTEWQPIPNTITMGKEEIKKLFCDLYNDFVYNAEYFCFDLINHFALKEWLRLNFVVE